jgi:hypothetical protein
MNKYTKIALFLSVVAMLLILPQQAFAAPGQFRQWRLAYYSDCECYKWKEFLIIVLPFASTGEESEANPQNFSHPDLVGDSHTLGACDADVCVINVLFTDFPMSLCQSVTWARLYNNHTFEVFEHNYTLKRFDEGLQATFVVDKEQATANRFGLTVHCSTFEPVPFE